MSANQIADRLAINTNEDMHWILISQNQCESEYLKASIPSKHRARGAVVYPLSELVQSRSKLASDFTKAAANSML